MIRNMSQKLLVLDRAIEAIKRDMPPDLLARLSPKQRELIEQYRKNTSDLQQYVDCINGTDPTAALLESVGLDAGYSEAEAQEAYAREVEKLNTWFSRRSQRRAVR